MTSIKFRCPGSAAKILLVMVVGAVTTPLFATDAVTNGGFESGDLTGWTRIGLGQATGSGIGVTPTEGSFQGYIETTGNLTALAPAVAASLGLSGPAIAALGAGTPVNGTGISQNVTVSAGDTLSFDWNFLTSELTELPMYNDFGFFSISGSAFLLASHDGSTFNTISPPAGFEGQTGWMTQTYTFPSAGTYSIGFGVFNVGDAGHDSALVLDAVSVPVAVPEPTSATLSALALVGLVAWGWRRRHAELTVTREVTPRRPLCWTR